MISLAVSLAPPAFLVFDELLLLFDIEQLYDLRCLCFFYCGNKTGVHGFHGRLFGYEPLQTFFVLWLI